MKAFNRVLDLLETPGWTLARHGSRNILTRRDESGRVVETRTISTRTLTELQGTGQLHSRTVEHEDGETVTRYYVHVPIYPGWIAPDGAFHITRFYDDNGMPLPGHDGTARALLRGTGDMQADDTPGAAQRRLLEMGWVRLDYEAVLGPDAPTPAQVYQLKLRLGYEFTNDEVNRVQLLRYLERVHYGPVREGVQS